MHNDVPQGLSSSIFTLDQREAETFMSAAGLRLRHRQRQHRHLGRRDRRRLRRREDHRRRARERLGLVARLHASRHQHHQLLHLAPARAGCELRVSRRGRARRGAGRDRRRRGDGRERGVPPRRGRRHRHRAAREGRPRGRLDVALGRWRSRAVLGRRQHRARCAQPPGVRAVRLPPRCGDRPAPGRLPVPAHRPRRPRRRRAGGGAAELDGRAHAAAHRRRGGAAEPRRRHRRRDRRDLPLPRRLLQPGVGRAGLCQGRARARSARSAPASR